MPMSQANISKSIKCFEEVKTLRLLSSAKDTQLTAASNIIADYKMLADTLAKDVKTKDQELQQQAKQLKRQKAFLTIAKYAIAIETLYIISNKIF
jgi:predicted metal-dependent enzyme (double-stranded beta helix superfamily)